MPEVTSYMRNEIIALEPAAVWRSFADLNEIPRPSKKEEKVIRFMLNFGRSLGLETSEDSVGNILIRKPASKGMENRKPVILQAHLDMVHQKNADTAFDFERQGIEMFTDGDWVRAKGTTLGADNGMGVASMMAILASDRIVHPPLEALFTIDEETGMTGAKGLQPGVLRGQVLLNLDTEEDDEIDIGCAGGVDITATRSYHALPPDPGAASYTLTVKGLRGGHSGMDIHLGLGNANKIMNELLAQASESCAMQLVSIDGGGLRNAIPRESSAQFTVPSDQKETLEAAFPSWGKEIADSFAALEPGLNIQLAPTVLPPTVLEDKAQNDLLEALAGVPNGVYRMDRHMESLVAASNNLARVSVKDGNISVGCLARSSDDSLKEELAETIKATFEKAGMEVGFSGEYPGWSPNPGSEILQLLVARYKELFKEEPRVISCHAGLECGIIGAVYPDLDMISFGPTIRGAHSPDERVQISSVQKYWKLLLDVLQHIPEK